VLAKHGFSGLIHDLGFGGNKEADDLEGPSTPRRLRLACEELGPTFVKLGQILSTRPDLLPPSYIHEFSKLTDQIQGFEFSEVLKMIESDFGRDVYEIFEWIEETPIAAASIAQVHRARLRDTNESVVIKVQRPGIESTIQADIQVLYFVARGLEKIRDEFKLLNLPAIVKEFQRTVNEEIDFTLEARNIDKFAENFPHFEGVEIPKVFWAFTSKRILTMSELKGLPLSQMKDLPAHIDRKKLAEQIVTFFFESMFFHGLFHADAHPGNVLLIDEGSGKLGLLDFGMVGTLDLNIREKLSKIFLAVVSNDFETLTLTYSEIGEFGRRFSLREFQNDIRDFMAPHLGKPLKEINIGQLLLDSTTIARKFQVKLPRDLIMFYRSMMTLEALGRKLDPDFEFVTYGKKFAQTLIRRRFSADEIFRDLFKTLEGLRTLGTEVPGQVRNLIHRLDQSDALNGNQSLERSLEALRRSQRQFTLALVTLGLFLLSIFLSALRPDYFALTYLWIASFTSLASFLFMSIRK
jgi:ubiquinone biosynthesis protein